MKNDLLMVSTVSLIFVAVPLLAQDPNGARREFERNCSGCHGGDGNGGEHAPSLLRAAAGMDNFQLETFLRKGKPNAGMPSFNSLNDTEIREVIRYVRTLTPSAEIRTTVQMRDGHKLEGRVLSRRGNELQLLGNDQKIHLLRMDGNFYRAVTSDQDWATYNGDAGGNRYSHLDQIKTANADRLVAKWAFDLPDAYRLEATPVVFEGVMYVTAANECYALDAGSGRQLWHYKRPLTIGVVGNGANAINRGAAVAGNRVFMETDNARLLALDRHTGKLLWDSEIGDWHKNYNATSAPLIVGNTVVAGTSGGDEGVRGIVVSFDQETGKELWRFHTIPAPGEPGSETWSGSEIINHGGGATWLTGSYDAELNLIYWTTGNPGADFYGDNRKGDNLYSCSVVALDAKTGKLRWHFQFTPHDEWDYDATETPVLIDSVWDSQPRKLLVQANRNGFLYVLDRTNGKMLRANPLVKKLTWAKGITPEGRPISVPGKEPTAEGNLVCPALQGATNWYSPSYYPIKGLFYVQTMERCTIFRNEEVPWEAGKTFMGGAAKTDPEGQKILRAFDLRTGKVAWEYPQIGPADSYGGTLATAGGLVFLADDTGAFVALDASTGKRLWSFQTNDLLRASPMTYSFDGKQYVSIAASSNVFVFGLPE